MDGALIAAPNPAPEAKRPKGATAGDDALALYVHWPFCRAKCPYCDFNSHVRAAVDHGRWRAAFARELERVAALSGPRELRSIFFGGGTPSLMEPETVAAVIERATGLWRPADDLEITLEANPTSVEREAFRGFAQAGVDRLSLGVQALDDPSLARLGREHDAAQALAALEVAAATFPRWSFDLIYARPWQKDDAWAAELEQALALGPRHLSLYQLVIEPGTRYAAMVKSGALEPLSLDRQADLFAATRARLAAAGLPAYETSNHASPGEESRHNLVYWRYGDYVGVGPGAHGRVRADGGKWACLAWRQPERWLEAVEQRGSGDAEREALSRRDQVIEALLMGVRLEEGLPLARLETLAGGETALAAFLDLGQFALLRAEGWLADDPRTIRANERGALAADFIASRLAR